MSSIARKSHVAYKGDVLHARAKKQFIAEPMLSIREVIQSVFVAISKLLVVRSNVNCSVVATSAEKLSVIYVMFRRDY
jgi:hypothetical protein